MPCPLLIFTQSDSLIQIVDINSYTEWQTVQIQIWIYTVFKDRVHPVSAGQGLTNVKRDVKYQIMIICFDFAARAEPCQSGYLLYSDSGSRWKKVFVILFKDSTFAWFHRPRQRQPIHHVMLRVIIKFFCAFCFLISHEKNK